jgi:hypothetical protein
MRLAGSVSFQLLVKPLKRSKMKKIILAALVLLYALQVRKNKLKS